jgi:hypothetical protein
LISPLPVSLIRTVYVPVKFLMGREEEKYWARRLPTSFAGWKDTFGLASSHRCLNERSDLAEAEATKPSGLAKTLK